MLNRSFKLNLEYWYANKNVDGKDQAQEFSVGNKESIGIWTQDYVYYAFAEILSTFCLCPEIWEITETNDGINNLA